jgi:UDP-N-acetyl-D-glucosamine dehydrogenase
VVQRVADALNSVGKPVKGSRVHIFGVAYKKDVGDVRESPALDIIELLAKRGARISFTDPFVRTLGHEHHTLVSVPFDRALDEGCDCAVLCTDHSAFDYRAMIERIPLIVDTRNALKGFAAPAIVRL